jgi:hypothetical protein
MEGQQTPRQYQWDVFEIRVVGGKHLEDLVETVEADTADHACDWICQSKWIARTRLVAYPHQEAE